MHHRKARKTRLARFVKLPYMVEAGVLRYSYPFGQCHTPFWWSNSCCEISNRTVLRSKIYIRENPWVNTLLYGKILLRRDRPYKTGIGFQGRFLVRGAFQAMLKWANCQKPGNSVKSSWRMACVAWQKPDVEKQSCFIKPWSFLCYFLLHQGKRK